MKKYILTSLLLAFFLFPANIHSKVLDLPLAIQEQDQWCWAAVSQSMLSFYGSDIDQCEIAEYTRTNADWHDFGDVHCCVDPSQGCNYWNYTWGAPGSIQDILNNWDVQVNNLARHLTEQEVTSEINSDKPFIIRWAWNTGGGHFVNGYGVNDSMVSYMDPWFSEGHKTALYSWVVSGGNHEWTHTQTIRQAPGPSPAPPPSPVQLYPADGSTVIGTSVTFAWEPAEGADYYWLQVRPTHIFLDYVYENIGNVTSYTWDNAPADGTEVMWQVMAGNDAGDGPWSGNWFFTSGQAAPALPGVLMLLLDDE